MFDFMFNFMITFFKLNIVFYCFFVFFIDGFYALTYFIKKLSIPVRIDFDRRFNITFLGIQLNFEGGPGPCLGDKIDSDLMLNVSVDPIASNCHPTDV
jgi:uncharacterized membrane-anchored protein YitT (DUF2179 family)